MKTMSRRLTGQAAIWPSKLGVDALEMWIQEGIGRRWMEDRVRTLNRLQTSFILAQSRTTAGIGDFWMQVLVLFKVVPCNNFVVALAT